MGWGCLGVALLGIWAPGVPGEPEDGVLFSCDFESDTWWQAWGEKKPPSNCALVDGEAALGGRGKSLKVTVPKGSNAGANFHYRFRELLGYEPEEIYFRYYVKFDPDWKGAVDGGKMPGFEGTYGKAGWGGRPVNGKDGWSARGAFVRPAGDETQIGFYCYHADMKGKYGSIFKFKPPLRHGAWTCVELYGKLNTPGDPGRNDGILRGWIDGTLAFEKTDLRFRDVDTLKIETVWVNVYHGGTTPAPEDLHLYLDDLVISRQPIGPRREKK
jgi:hypothetical protein